MFGLLLCIHPLSASAQDSFGPSDPQPPYTQVTRLRSIRPSKAVELIKEVYEHEGDGLKIVVDDETQAIILRGPEQLVQDTATLLNDLDQGEDFEQDVEVEDVDVIEFGVDMGALSPEDLRGLDVPLGKLANERVALNADLTNLDSAERHRELVLLSQEFQASKKAEDEKAMKRVEQQVRKVLQDLHEENIDRQRKQIERLRHRLERLTERIEQREQKQASAIEEAVCNVLDGKVLPQIHAYHLPSSAPNSFKFFLEMMKENPELQSGPDHLRRQAVEHAIRAGVEADLRAREAQMKHQHAVNELEIHAAQGHGLFLGAKEDAKDESIFGGLGLSSKDQRTRLKWLEKEMQEKRKELEQVHREMREAQIQALKKD